VKFLSNISAPVLAANLARRTQWRENVNPFTHHTQYGKGYIHLGRRRLLGTLLGVCWGVGGEGAGSIKWWMFMWIQQRQEHSFGLGHRRPMQCNVGYVAGGVLAAMPISPGCHAGGFELGGLPPMQGGSLN